MSAMAVHAPIVPCTPRTNSTRRPIGSPSSMLSHEEHCQRKRRRARSVSKDIEEQPNAKRRKTASHNHPPEFWNALSKITLTRKALREFDRRTTQEQTTSLAGTVKRSTRLLRSDTKRLLRFAKNGGPNLNHLRGYAGLPHPVAVMSKSNSRTRKRTRDSGLPSNSFTASTSTTGPYDPQFEQMLIDNGVYPDGYRITGGARPPKPENLNEIRQKLSQSRPSLSPSAFSETAFEDFQDMNRMARSESKAMSSVIPIITGDKDRQCQTEENKQFNNLEKFAPGLRMAQPDKYYGARPIEIDETVRQDLGKYIIPSTSTALPIAPNFFFEGKSAAGKPDVAHRQVMHDNAYGARAMFQLQNYGKERPVYDGNTYTLASSYSDGQLKLYSTHPRQSASGGTEYYMTQLDTYGMTGNIEAFRRGATAYRNSRDFAEDRRNLFIAKANATARSASTHQPSSSRTNHRTGISFAMTNGSFGSETSTDELALDYHSASDESDGKARPRKRTTSAAAPHSHLNTQSSISKMQMRNNSSLQETRKETRNQRTDGGQDEDQAEDEDEDDIHTVIHGGSTPNEAALALQRSQSAHRAMARLLKQGHSKDAAFKQLVVAHEKSKRVSRQVAIGEVRAMLAFRS